MMVYHLDWLKSLKCSCIQLESISSIDPAQVGAAYTRLPFSIVSSYMTVNKFYVCYKQVVF
jgi:hypothetical protein